MSRDRGIRLQNALAAYLRQWWPSAESAGSGRPGTDVLGTPGVVWENKTAAEWDVLAWVRQARRHTTARVFAVLGEDGRDSGQSKYVSDIPIVVYWPRGIGEQSADLTLCIVPTGVMVRLLREAGY